METWQNGATSIKMPNYCKSDGYAHNIQNVREVRFADGRSWQESQDHSKWAVSDAIGRTACIGDINRQTSQRKRGGGTVCYNNANLWKAFDEIVSTYDECISAQNVTAPFLV